MQTGTSNTGKDFYNTNSTTQMAENNYWGGACAPAASQIYGSIDQNKQIIATQPSTQAAVNALQQYYSFVRTDDQDKLGQRSAMDGDLDGIYKQHSTIGLGKTALQLMIIESRCTDDLATAIGLSEKALAEISPDDSSGVRFNLVFMYLHDGRLTNAQYSVSDSKTRYPNDLTAIELLEGTLEKAPEMGARTGTKVQSVTTQPGDENTLELLQENANNEALFQSYPNPFNSSAELRFQLPA